MKNDVWHHKSTQAGLRLMSGGLEDTISFTGKMEDSKHKTKSQGQQGEVHPQILTDSVT
jgi:hypothetical protein